MTKKHTLTQELVNIYPSWSRTRQDPISVGSRLLNSFSSSLVYMEKSLEKMKSNIYLTKANLDEIDIAYKVLLPKEFEFTLASEDPLEVCYIPPVASGLHLGEWYTVELAEENSLASFWYDSLPDRFSLTEVVSGINDQLLTFNSEDGVISGLWKHHLADTSNNGGKLWIEVTGGTQYIRVATDNTVERGRVKLTGRTKKGTFEDETIIFAWDSKQETQKEWEEITQVDTFDMEDGIQIDLRSSDISTGPYIDFWNLRFSDNRKKIDEFWNLEFITGKPILSRIEYITDEWQQLILGFSNKDSIDRWELLDDNNNIVSGIDIAIQPFTDRSWLVTDGGLLYCYDLIPDMPSGLDLLVGATPGSNVIIELENSSIILGEELEFIPWHARPIQEIRNYKLWYQTPSGTRVDLSDITLVEGTELTRSIENYSSFTPVERGTYLLVLEATFVDNTTHIFKTLAEVTSKKPLISYDISALIPGTIEGIEFDGDQKMWIKTNNNNYYHLAPHTDQMLIDYQKKIVYFHEPYQEVDIGKD